MRLPAVRGKNKRAENLKILNALFSETLTVENLRGLCEVGEREEGLHLESFLNRSCAPIAMIAAPFHFVCNCVLCAAIRTRIIEAAGVNAALIFANGLFHFGIAFVVVHKISESSPQGPRSARRSRAL